jgi:hypothetical protein
LASEVPKTVPISEEVNQSIEKSDSKSRENKTQTIRSDESASQMSPKEK